MPVSALIEFFRENGYAQYPVVDQSGETIGVVTKAETMKQLIKTNVTPQDPVSKLVQRELRHVSKNITLAELGRILARNKFAIVDEVKFVTTTDLLNKVCPKEEKKAESSCCKKEKAEATPETPATPPDSARSSSSVMKMAAATVGVGIMAVGGMLMMKQNK